MPSISQRARQRAISSERIASLLQDARALGGAVKQGLGEYDRELVASQRTPEEDAAGAWVARWTSARADDAPRRFEPQP